MFETIENDTEGYYPELALSIEYRNGSLYDIGQDGQYGDGITGWIDDLEAEAKKNTYDFEAYRAGNYESAVNPKELAKELLKETSRSRAADAVQSLLQPVGIMLKKTQGLLIRLDSRGLFRVSGRGGDGGLFGAVEKALNGGKVGRKLVSHLLNSVGEEQRKRFIGALQKTLTTQQIDKLKNIQAVN